MHIEEVEDTVIIDLRKITKLEIQEDNLMIHEELNWTLPNQYGRVSRCANSQSIYHWFKDCPHNVQGSNSKVTIFTQEVQKCYVQNFLGETRNLAVLDSGCTKAICGQEWLKCLTESLCDVDRRKIQEFTSETEFKFGDGKVVASETSVVIPCNNAGKNVSLKTDVVKSEIPLLLNNESMKAAESIIDFVNDRINMFGKDIHLNFTTSGHYAIPLNETNLNLKTSSVEHSNFVEVLLTIDNIEEKSKKEKKYIAIKLHKHFGHPKSAR